MDLQKHSITHLPAVAIAAMPRFYVEAQICDSTTGHVLFDFTGPLNGITFPGFIGTLALADRQEFALMIAAWMLRKKAGL